MIKMLSNNAFARIHKRIYNRMLVRLRKPFKKIREQFITEHTVPNVTDDLQVAIYTAMVTGFVFGKGSIVIELFKREKKFMDVADAQIMQFVLTQDKDIWHAIAGKTLFKAIMSEADAMAAYFAPSEGALTFLKDYSFDVAQVQMRDIADEAQALFRKAMMEGMSNDQAAKFIKKNIENLTNKRAKAIARTESTRAFSLGTLHESQTSAIVKGYRYNSVLDGLTTDICKARNGKYIPKTDIMMVANNTPPLHVNCRSRLETVLLDEKEGEGMPVNIPPGKQRPQDVQAVQKFLGGGIVNTPPIVPVIPKTLKVTPKVDMRF